MLAINMTGDCLRSCSMYITYALEKVRDEEQHLHLKGQAYSTSRSRSPSQNLSQAMLTDSPGNGSVTHPELSTSQMASRILKVYADLVCLPGDTANIMKFAKTVTNKVRISCHKGSLADCKQWLLNLLVSDDSEVVTQVTRILARLLVVNGSSYVKRFSEETGGMIILQHRLHGWCHVPAIWRTCLAILFGRDIADIELEKPFNLYGLVDDFLGTSKSPRFHPQILPVLISMMQSALKALNLESSDIQSSASDRSATAPVSASHGNEDESLNSKMSEPKIENNSSLTGMCFAYFTATH